MSNHSALGGEALDLLLACFKFDTVLDVGCGAGYHSRVFKHAGKTVTGIDLSGRTELAIRADYLEHEFAAPFDCLWISHVLEHQLRPHDFLRKVHRDLREGGMLAITVPPLKHEIVGGHVSLWNLGLLLYHLILAGFDCSQARCRRYGYNISVVTRKQSIAVPHDRLRFARGDIEQLAGFFPACLGLTWRQAFDGNLTSVNWASQGEWTAADGKWPRWLRRLTGKAA